MKMRFWAGLALVLGLAVGFAAGRLTEAPENGAWEAAFVHGVEAAGFAAASLELLDRGEADRARKLQTQHLRAGVESAYSSIDRVEAVDFPLPNLVEFAARVERLTAERQELADLRPRARAVHEHVRELSDRAVSSGEHEP